MSQKGSIVVETLLRYEVVVEVKSIIYLSNHNSNNINEFKVINLNNK